MEMAGNGGKIPEADRDDPSVWVKLRNLILLYILEQILMRISVRVPSESTPIASKRTGPKAIGSLGKIQRKPWTGTSFNGDSSDGRSRLEQYVILVGTLKKFSLPVMSSQEEEEALGPLYQAALRNGSSASRLKRREASQQLHQRGRAASSRDGRKAKIIDDSLVFQLRRLRDSRNLRFQKVFEQPPEPGVVLGFLVMVACLYFIIQR
eukprot:scaffold149_cov315-Pinguiococcus_pyrenoidosus.AAC.128